VVVEFLSVAPRPDGIQEAPPRNQIETPRGFRLLYVHESRSRKLAHHSADTTGRKLGRKPQPSAIPNLGVSHQIIRTPPIFARIRPAALQASLHAPTAQPNCSVLRDLHATQTGDLASNNLKDKWRAINTWPNPKLVRAKCAGVT
jgi:hypothetical protein